MPQPGQILNYIHAAIIRFHSPRLNPGSQFLYAYEKFWRVVIDEEVHFRVQYQDGFDKGMVKGREEGRAEERLKNTRSLKANGIPFDVIASSLGLSQDEIEAL